MLLFISNLWANNRPMAILLAILIVVIPFMVFYINKARKEHPKGLIAAALSNMGERFGYYIMNAVLLLFICSKFGISDSAAGWIYSVFYFLIYVLSLPGGIIADRTQNYKGTIIAGLLVMAAGYGILSIPVFAATTGVSWVLVLTCVALFIIAFGNGLFKGNLQALVGQMYDNFEAEAAKKGPEALAEAKDKRDSGFQIFYVFINIGGVIAPFIAPLLRSFWLKIHDLAYNSDLPRLCHMFIKDPASVAGTDAENLTKLATEVGHTGVVDATFCNSYLEIFNTGVHFSFIASVLAMLISLFIFIAIKKKLPNPAKKEKAAVADYTPEEREANAKEIRQRLYALFAVLGVAVFFWFSFHQNGQSLSIFARDFVTTASIPPEIWPCTQGQGSIYSSQDRHRYVHRGMRLHPPHGRSHGSGISFRRRVQRSFRRSEDGHEVKPCRSDRDILLPHSGRALHLTSRTLVRIEDRSTPPSGYLPGTLAYSYSYRKPVHRPRSDNAQHLPSAVDVLGRIRRLLPHLDGRDAWNGQVA